MSDNLAIVLRDIVCGFRDSFLGLNALCEIYQEAKNEANNEKQAPQKPMTTLEKRRAERKGKSPNPTPQKKSNVIHRIALCCAWNGGVFLMSIVLFNYTLLPVLQTVISFIFGGSSSQNMVWLWIWSVVNWLFHALWILPLFILSKLVNCFWFQDIADAAYRKTRGRPLMLSGLGKMIADLLFTIILQMFFLVQGMLASLLPLPYIGVPISTLHVCLLYSLYAFEYKWFNMGWEVHQRVYYIEQRWPYFVGFGLPLAILTALPESYIISGCIFSILFPLYIISGNEADAQPAASEIPMPLFRIVIRLTDIVFQQSVRKSTAQLSSSQTQKHTPAKKHVTIRETHQETQY